jgi:hypothetical protein
MDVNMTGLKEFGFMPEKILAYIYFIVFKLWEEEIEK